MEQNIIKFNFDGTLYNVRPHCICDTLATNPVKLVNIEGFSEVAGATVLVKFIKGNSAECPMFGVSNGTNSSAANFIKYQGNSLEDPKLYDWAAGTIIEFFFDGSFWNVISISPTYDLSSYASINYVDDKVSTSLTSYQPLMTTIADTTSTAASISNMLPNTLYTFSKSLSSLTINSLTTVSGGYCEYMLEFTPSNSFSFNWKASTISWVNGKTPAWSAGSKFHVSVVNNLAVSGKF